MVEKIIDLPGMMKRGSEDEIWAIRAKAIQSYANLEQALCRMFCHLGGMSMDVAGIVFFKISSSQARNDILEKLFKLKYYSQFNVFRNSLFKRLRPIDTKRNEIVHWNMVNNLTGKADGETEFSISLRPPAFWTQHSDDLKVDTNDLVAFIFECKFFAWIIGMFPAINGPNPPQFSPDELQTWRDIFLQPITYPPPEGDPLYKIAVSIGIQLPPSPQSPELPSAHKKKKAERS